MMMMNSPEDEMFAEMLADMESQNAQLAEWLKPDEASDAELLADLQQFGEQQAAMLDPPSDPDDG